MLEMILRPPKILQIDFSAGKLNQVFDNYVKITNIPSPHHLELNKIAMG
jgi:hypothetical protein